MIDEEDIQIRLLPRPEPALLDGPALLQVPAPHGAVKLEGALCCGRSTARRRAQISDIVLPPLSQLVRQVVEWSGPSVDADQYLGDYRFLVLNVRTASGTDAYVQIWSEPHDQLLMEVGPGNREDALLQAFADGIRDPLLDRGFAIGGNANNYRKALSVPSSEDAPQVAREMLAILLDVLAYDGQTDVTYKFQQDSNLKDAHVLWGIDRSTLCMLLQRLGLRATPSAAEPTVIEAMSLERDFQLQLNSPQPPRKGNFWEIHCLTNLTMAADEASSLVEKVNGRPYLIKAHVVSLPGEPIQEVRLTIGINLAGGVTLDHIRAQISEFLQVVRKLSLDRQS
jgi:hypothetical protein